jgi:nucleoside 2-deoxyribosyltransferase
MKVYVASSWRNPLQAAIVCALRSIGHEVYDFKNPAPGDNGFSWKEVMPNYALGGKVSPQEFREGLKHPIAQAGYSKDITALRWCDAVVYVMPCGRSASWEFGYAMGQNKAGYVVMFGDDEPDLMFSEAKILTSMDELFDAFGEPTGRKVKTTAKPECTCLAERIAAPKLHSVTCPVHYSAE